MSEVFADLFSLCKAKSYRGLLGTLSCHFSGTLRLTAGLQSMSSNLSSQGYVHNYSIILHSSCTEVFTVVKFVFPRVLSSVLLLCVFNPRRAKVTVVGLSVCLSVCLCVC